MTSKKFLFVLKFLMIFLTIIACYVNAWPQHAGTCDVQKVDSSPHAGDNGKNIVQGDGGFKITVSKESDDYHIKLDGSEPIHGILVYVEDNKGTRFGEFALDDNKLLQYKSCGGTGEHNTITHTSKDPKNLPLELKWKPGDTSFDEATVHSVVVLNFTRWFHLEDVKFKSS
uniref:Putative ferric-chelate reductase 1 n=1 Tax=Anthurium amnicola TaxID=1678845 RepID=A0A1D1YE50_9ARAE